MSDNHLRHYRVLGIHPGASWKQLRQAYKKQVNLWHPDRFQQDARRKKQAEEKTKEITQAYKELAEYHKRHGALPLTAEEPEPSVTGAAPASATGTEHAGATVGTPEPAEAPSPVSPAFWRTPASRRMRFAIALTLLGAGYYFWHPPSSERSRSFSSDTTAVAPNPAPDPEQNGTPSAAPPPASHFTVGSSLGDVYAIQGVPTRTEGDIWHYGNSKIYFSSGKVLRWEESMDSPLRVGLVPDAATAVGHGHYFHRGSTRAEVLAVQGTPDRDAGNVWDYGVSRVYFEGDRVSGWQEAPLHPLKVRP